MAEIVPGYTTENKVISTANDDAAINGAIAVESANNWLVSSITYNPDTLSVIILFTRTIATAV